MRSLTIGDLVEACGIYFENGEEKTIENLLSKNPEEIYLCWDIIPKKNIKKITIMCYIQYSENKYIYLAISQQLNSI